MISVGGPQSAVEAEAKKKFITEKEIREIIDSPSLTLKELRLVKAKIRDLLEFYDRIISSITATLKTVETSNISNSFKQDKYVKGHEKELSQAKNEKSKIRRYLSRIDSMIDSK